jgi:hypothetical protein
MSIACQEIKQCQEILRHANPNSPLLEMVKFLPTMGTYALHIGRNFESILSEHTLVETNDSHYVALGYYVELLKSEISNPRFLPKVY